ncbi:MAG TPA: hypothetical protein VGL93_12500 [Streptosporangiaceae bacterium]|jgi:hypothetical protein
MANRSIYARPNAAVTGGSEQAHYEHLWGEGQRQRLIVRGVIAGIVLIAGSLLFNPIVGVILALLAAGADVLYQWRKHASTAAWRSGDGGRGHTDRLMRLMLEWRGFTVLRNRRLPDPGAEAPAETENDGVQHLVIGPSGVFLVRSMAWSPDTQIGSYGGKLFFGKRSGDKWIGPVADAARAVSAALSEAIGEQIPVTAVMALHGGRVSGRTAIHCQGVTLLRARRVPGWVRNHQVRRPATRTAGASSDSAADTSAEPYTPEQVEGLARTAARVLRPRPLLPRT